MQLPKGVLTANEFVVLCHGAHLNANNWYELVMGDIDQDIIGRAPRAIEVALVHGASAIIWATGASEKDGVKEAVYTYDCVMQELASIHLYLVRTHVSLSGMSLSELRARINVLSVFDEVTQNTTEEVAYAATVAKAYGCPVVVQVSSPTHIQRCYAESVKLNFTASPTSQVFFIPVVSDTCFLDSTPADVVVSEPPHRGDNRSLWLPRLFRVFFRLMTWEQARAKAVIEDVCVALARHDIYVDPDTIIKP